MQTTGMLTIDDLRDLVEQSRGRHGAADLHRYLWPPVRKASGCRLFSGSDDAGNACLRLSADHRHGDGSRHRDIDSRNWERGYGDFHMRADMSTLRIATLAGPHCAGDLRSAARRLPRVGGGSAAFHFAASNRAGREMGYRPMAGSELEYYIFNNSYRQAAAAGYDGLGAGRMVSGGLSRAAGHAGGEGERRGPSAPGAIGHSGGMLQGRVGQGAARIERAIQPTH